MAEKQKVEFYLGCLVPNLHTEAGDLPTLDETLAGYAGDARLREKIAGLTDSNAVNRFYAALLMWSPANAEALEILSGLRDDETPLIIPKSVGHGAVEVPINLLVRDFSDQKDFPGENLRRVETLANWKAAIRSVDGGLDEDALPRYEDLLKAQTDPEKMRSLRPRIEKLKAGSVAEKFYVAALVKPFDEAEAREILEELVDDPTQVGILNGDIMINFPASHVAGELLGQPEGEAPADPNPVSRFLKWLNG